MVHIHFWGYSDLFPSFFGGGRKCREDFGWRAKLLPPFADEAWRKFSEQEALAGREGDPITTYRWQTWNFELRR